LGGGFILAKALADIILLSSSDPPLANFSIVVEVASPENPSACSIRLSIASRTPAFLVAMFKMSDSNCTRIILDEVEFFSELGAIKSTSFSAIL
jgi:hypothetical protein